MAPDDERPEAKAGRPLTQDPDVSTSGPTDLNSLSASLGPGADGSVEDEAGDLSALATVGRVGGSSLEPGRAQEQGAEAKASPAAAPARSRGAWALPLVIGLALGLGSAGALFAISGHRDDRSELRPPAQPTQRNAIRQEPAPAALAVPSRAAPESAPDPAPPPAPPTAPEPSVATPVATPPQTPSRPRDAKPVVAAAPPVTAAAATPRAAAASPQSSRAPGAAVDATPAGTPPPRSVDALLDEALAPRGAPPAADNTSAAAPGTLPLTPSREDVTRAMTVLLPAIRGCTQGQSGLATATIVVRNDGHVAKVDVQGAPFAEAPSGRCMEGVIRRARFPAFRQASFRVKFPFAIE